MIHWSKRLHNVQLIGHRKVLILASSSMASLTYYKSVAATVRWLPWIEPGHRGLEVAALRFRNLGSRRIAADM